MVELHTPNIFFKEFHLSVIDKMLEDGDVDNKTRIYNHFLDWIMNQHWIRPLY